ncbi:hypothetical protein CNPV012 [Canarypox virus]|uniref:SWPV2-ORF008 n=2 Tax=Canarypox virus TaxID=44088 RepID=A0A1V0QFX4_CNPV|nr:hypothetical protein CNPV012 [Canarypox virus]ARE67227.1 SWPV2-ORF008 [Shearwaterpox virus]QRI42729.1 hypothetical protein ChPV011 [Cheloniid poxvirus 1]QRM15288.1 hypothetical protein [Mudlarkpox virus]QRM15641.1 hypothetical protein [Penguinpox virus 2]QRM15971.1 hypothetical protein [Albatrosspox virus]
MGNNIQSQFMPNNIIRLSGAISDQNTLLVNVFDALNYEGKKLMIDSMSEPISESKDFEPYLFIKSLHDFGKLDSELSERLEKNISVINEYRCKSESIRPEILVNLDKIQDSVNTRLAVLNGINDIVEKENYINKIIDEFVYTGGFQNYMLLRSIYYNYSQIEGNLGYKAQNILDDAISKRKLYISSHKA